MAYGLIQDSTLNNIATAINTKLGESDTMTPSEMADKIGSIETGGSFIRIAEAEIINPWYVTSANSTQADYCDWDTFRQTGKLYIGDIYRKSLPITNYSRGGITQSALPPAFNEHLKMVTMGSGDYQLYLGNVSRSGSSGNYTFTFTCNGAYTINNINITSATKYAVSNSMNGTNVLLFDTGDAILFTPLVTSTPLRFVSNFCQVPNNATALKLRSMLMGCKFKNNCITIGTTDVWIDCLTNQVTTEPTSGTLYYCFAPCNIQKNATPYSSNKYGLGICGNEFIPMSGVGEISYTTKPTTYPFDGGSGDIRDIGTIDESDVFFNTNIISSSYIVYKKTYDGVITTIEAANATYLYDSDGVRIDEIHGWTYDSLSEKYVKGNESISLKGLVVDGKIFQPSGGVFTPIYYDEELDIFVTAMGTVLTSFVLLDNYAIDMGTSNHGVSYDTDGRIGFLEPVLQGKYKASEPTTVLITTEVE